MTELFTEKCLQFFKNSQHNSEYQLNCLRLIKTFINRFDGDHIVEEDLTQYDPKELKQVQITIFGEKVAFAVKVHPSQKFWQLKRKIANHLKLKMSEFFIKTKGGPLEEGVYNEQVKEYNIA